MAGEFEEPFTVSSQADSFNSGSISFGRFDSEDLSWERRSSFSHNRYLEEVEKCSKPGSVIEKKAYFEAHFKKKGILLPGSFDEGHNGGEYQNCENDDFEILDPGEEDDNLDGSWNYSLCDDGALKKEDSEEFDNGNEGVQVDYVNDGNHHTFFDESLEVSEYHGECEVMECARENPVGLTSESQVEAALDDSNVLAEGAHGDVKPEEAHENETVNNELHLINGRQEMEIKKILNDNSATVDDTSAPMDLSLRSGTTKDIDKTNAAYQQNTSPKLRASVESKAIKPRMKSPVNGSQVQKIVHNDVSKTAAKNQNRREREAMQRTKLEKQSPRAGTPTRHVLHGTKKQENSESCNAISPPVHIRVKEPRVKKVESPTSRSRKVEPIAHQSANRSRQMVSSIKPDSRPSAATFSFRSGERTERRKEFYMKLEEKMHSKGAEINQIQARTQEKTEAEMRQFRKSLLFKATPMPSFYHVAQPQSFNGNKAALSKTKPVNKVRHKPSSPGRGAAARSNSLSKAGNDQAFCAIEPVKTTLLPEQSGTADYPTTKFSEGHKASPTNNNSRRPEAIMKSGVTGKNARERVKDTNSQRQRVSENIKVSNEHKVEGKTKLGNRRSSSAMLRKRVGFGSNSGMGRLAVGVAS